MMECWSGRRSETSASTIKSSRERRKRVVRIGQTRFPGCHCCTTRYLVEHEGFKKYEWLPAMNTPVFSSSPGCTVDVQATAEGDFELGSIPKSCIRVGGDFTARYNYHTALLGVTGSGKTELAFDMIRHALDTGIRVVCIDLTAQYEDRLADLKPVDLSIDGDTATELGQKLFDVETGTYGATQEKKALDAFAVTLRDEVATSVKDFLEDEDGSHLGLIRLEEISNTKATLWITELYMTCLLKYARENLGSCPPTLIVVEEAHTVMPEPNTNGPGGLRFEGARWQDRADSTSGTEVRRRSTSVGAADCDREQDRSHSVQHDH